MESEYCRDRYKNILQACLLFLRSRWSDWMKECSLLGTASRIVAIDALETRLPSIISISRSFPSSFDGPREPFGRPSRRPRARAVAQEFHALDGSVSTPPGETGARILGP